MKKSDILALFKILQAYYGKKFDLPEKPENLELMILTWYEFLAEYDYEIVKVAAKRLMVNSEWPPTPGEIIKEIENYKAPEADQLDAGQAWALTLDAIERYSYFYNPDQVKKSLPEKALRAAEAVGLELIAREGAGNTYLYNHFKEIYKGLCEKEQHNKRLPASLRKESEMLAQKFKHPALEEGDREDRERNR